MGDRSMTSNFTSTISKNLHSSTALTCNIIFRREESKFLDNCDVALHNKWKKYFSFNKLDFEESMTFDAVTCQNDAFQVKIFPIQEFWPCLTQCIKLVSFRISISSMSVRKIKFNSIHLSKFCLDNKNNTNQNYIQVIKFSISVDKTIQVFCNLFGIE